MQRSIIQSIFICTSLTLSASACHKQDSQQSSVNATTTDARPDLANQPSSGPETNVPDSKDQVTTNPNSGRANADSTINTSRGAATVGASNMNPSSSSNIPTSVDTSQSSEPMSDAAVDAVDCRDAIANDYGGRTAPKTSTCLPTAQSRINSGATDQRATR
ncbi:MAG: hypothetical protein H7318_03940 [Oligoflexus sp.]|nr:hypothetical protein [Oligoflexus sp.]